MAKTNNEKEITKERFPNPRVFNPEKDEFPVDESIPEILEWKLDVIMALLARLAKGLNIFISIIIPGLAAIIVLLIAIWLTLTMIQALIAFGIFLLLFIIIRVVVPYLIKNALASRP